MHEPERTTLAADHGSAPHPETPPPRRPWSLLILLGVAEFMVILDATVVNVALPSIGRALHFAAGDLPWVVTAYVLFSGGLVLLGGRAADVLGRRATFLAGLAVFTAASLASGLAPSAGALIAARAGQGLGAALLTPAALSIIVTMYSGGPARRRAQRVGSTRRRRRRGGRAGRGDSDDLARVAVGVPGQRPGRGGGRAAQPAPGAAVRGSGPRPAGSLTCPVPCWWWPGWSPGCTRSRARPEHGWGSGRTLLLLAVSAGLLAAFAVVERAARRPLLPPPTWRSRSLVAGGPGDVRRHRDPGRHVLPQLAVPAGCRRRLAAAGGPGVPAARGGDRSGCAPHPAAAAAGRVARAGRGRPGCSWPGERCCCRRCPPTPVT